MPKPAWIFALFALGCAAKNPYLGSWDSDVTIMGNRIPLVSTFGERGDYAATFEVAGAKGKLIGTYKGDGEQLSIVVEKLELDSKASFLPQSMIDQGRAEIEKNMKQPLSGKVTWPTEDSFTVRPDRPGTPVLTFKRKAE